MEGTPPKGQKRRTEAAFGQIGLLTKVCFFTKAQVVFIGRNMKNNLKNAFQHFSGALSVLHHA